MSDDKPKKSAIDDDLREMTPLVLDSFGMPFERSGERITLEFDDVCRLIAALYEEHNLVHMIQENLRRLFPAVRLARYIETGCDSFHARFPTNDALDDFLNRQQERQAAAQRAEAQSGLQALLERAVPLVPIDHLTVRTTTDPLAEDAESGDEDEASGKERLN